MKIAVSILLSTLLFFNSSLFTIIYSIKVIELSFISSVKIRLVEENIENENFNYDIVHLLKLPVNAAFPIDLKWIEEDEFILKGRYCDVISKRNVNDTIYIFYINDNEEDELSLAAGTHYGNEESSNPDMKYFNILFSFLSNAICTSNTELYSPSSCSPYNNRCLFALRSNNHDIPSPPPRLIS